MQFHEDELADAFIFVDLILFAEGVIDVFVVVGAILNPRLITLPHRQERLPLMLVIPLVSHVKLQPRFSLLVEVHELSVVETSFTGVVDNVLFFYGPIIKGIA